MRHAYESDISSNKQGRPGLEKLKLLPTVLKKLKHLNFATIFLDANGLDVINNFISMLPDGSWPLSSVRSKIYEVIYRLPATIEHLRSTRLGRTLALLQASPKEFPKNKKKIQGIKDKWSRIICTIPVDYTHLEQCERNYVNLPMYSKREEDLEENVSR
jgi:transcription factor SPN1